MGPFDVIVIGGGVVESAIARELTKYRLHIGVLEKNLDVCYETSGRNSGVVHGGFAYDVGTLKAKLCVEGNQGMDELSKDLGFSFKRCGKVLVGKTAEDLETLKRTIVQGEKNGASELYLLSKEELPSGLPRNIEQCLNDYEIPLYLSHTITNIHGNERVTGVTVAKVDEHMKPIPGTEKDYTCDTVILSVGLIPENEISIDAGIHLDPRTKGAVVDEYFQTEQEGFFAAGNVLHVHDLVDFVSMEAEKLADGAVEYVKHGKLPECKIPVKAAPGINHTVPMKISGTRDVIISMRVGKKAENCTVAVCQGDKILAKKYMKKALPAEMIQIPVKKEAFAGEQEVEVRIL